MDDILIIRAKAEAIETCRRNHGFVLDKATFLGGWKYRCELCQCLFRTKAARAAHLAKKHGVRSKVSAAFGTACQVCNVEYWQEHRLRQHLRASARCREAYFHSDIGGQGGTKEDSGRLVGAWRVPSILEGPQPWWATLGPVENAVREVETSVDVPASDVISKLETLSICDLGFIHFCERVFEALKGSGSLDICFPEEDREESVVARSMLSFLQGRPILCAHESVSCKAFGSLLLLHRR